jgi:hypothetical protein
VAGSIWSTPSTDVVSLDLLAQWAGTPIESWSDNATNRACGPNLTSGAPRAHMAVQLHAPPDTRVRVHGSSVSTVDAASERGALGADSEYSGPNPISGNGVLFNAMIYPFSVGPLALSSIIWWQGESNILCQGGCKGWQYYGCQQNALITSWREYFQSPGLPFLYVPLEPWTGCCSPESLLPQFRELQDAALTLPNVGYGTAIDIADPQSPFTAIHPRNKKLVGERLAAAALSILYNQSTPYKMPSFASASVSRQGQLVTVTVSFDDVPTTLVAHADHCEVELGVPEGECGFPTIWGSDGRAYNASIAIGAEGKVVVLSANTSTTDVTVAAHSYGFNTFPVNLVFSAEGLPVRPWLVNLTAAH